MGVDGGSGMRFECLRCGKESRVEGVGAIQPRCASCGSGTGVLGDIGQGTRQAREGRRRSGAQNNDDVNFECLRCGVVTPVKQMEVARPACAHCGSRDGVVVNAD